MTNGDCFKYSRLVQHLTINQHNPIHQQAKEKKTHMIISIDVDKTFHNPIHILNKNSQQTWNNRNFYSLIKNVWKESPIVSNILNVDRLFL